MYCTKCGKFLAGNENFCSNCGEKVAKAPDAAEIKKEKKEKVEKKTIKIISPIDDFTWDIKEFPSSKPKKTEDADFSWNSGDMFLHKEIVRENSLRGNVTENDQVKEQISNSFCFRGNTIESERQRKAEEEAQRKEAEEKKNRKNTASNLEVPSVFKYRLDKMEEKESYGISDDIPDFLKDNGESNTVTRNTTPYEMNDFESEHVVEIEQPSTGGITVELGEEEKPGIASLLEKMEENEDPYEEVKEEFGSAAFDVTPEAPSFTPEAPSFTPEASSFTEEAPAEKKEEHSLLDEIVDEVRDALEKSEECFPEENKTIDKFYTFNKKKEEFQKLLDREYERMEGKVEKGGFEDDISSFMDVSTGKEVENTSQIEEMIKARAMFFDDPMAREYVESLEEEERAAKEAAERAINEYSVDEDIIDETPAETVADVLEGEKAAEESVMADEVAKDDLLSEVSGAEEAVEVSEEPAAEASEGEDIENGENDEDGEAESAEAESAEAEEAEDMDPPVTEVVFEPENGESLAEALLEKEAEAEAASEAVEAEEAKEVEVTEEKVEVADKNEDENLEETEQKDSAITEAAVDITGIATVIIDPVQEKKNMTEKLAEEFFEDDGEVEKRSGKGLMAVLLVLIFLVAGLMATRVLMPDTVISKYIDTVAQKAVELIEGVIPGESSSEDTRETLIEDKTSLIELQEFKNYNSNIKEIVYDENAAYSADKEYEFKDLADAKDIQTNIWYEEDGRTYYYDESIVGLMIAFESERTAYVNEGEKHVFYLVEKDSSIEKILEKEEGKEEKITFDKLGIGDIKVAGDSYYVWVSETVNEETDEKVYRVKEIDSTLVIVDVCEG